MKVLSIKEKSYCEVKYKMEKKIILVSGDFSLKFYDPNRLEIWTKIISVLEENGSKIKQLRQHEESDGNEAVLDSCKYSVEVQCSSERFSSHVNFCSF